MVAKGGAVQQAYGLSRPTSLLSLCYADRSLPLPSTVARACGGCGGSKGRRGCGAVG